MQPFSPMDDMFPFSLSLILLDAVQVEHEGAALEKSREMKFILVLVVQTSLKASRDVSKCIFLEVQENEWISSLAHSSSWHPPLGGTNISVNFRCPALSTGLCAMR